MQKINPEDARESVLEKLKILTGEDFSSAFVSTFKNPTAIYEYYKFIKDQLYQKDKLIAIDWKWELSEVANLLIPYGEPPFKVISEMWIDEEFGSLNAEVEYDGERFLYENCDLIGVIQRTNEILEQKGSKKYFLCLITLLAIQYLRPPLIRTM